MSKISNLGHALYQGDVSVDFVGRKWLWYAVSGLIVLVAVLGLAVRGMNLGIEFEGGVEYRVSMPQSQSAESAVQDVRGAVANSGIEAAAAPVVNTSGDNGLRLQTEPLTPDQANKIATIIQQTAGVSDADVSQDSVGATWGSQVAERALIGLFVFLVLVVLFIWAYFREWKMSVSAIVALAHDMTITVGVYALSGFEVTPATVTGLLTILGFSLYDTVVVFDKVRENTKNLARSHKTYAEAANLAVNQTLVRSINTSIVALLPVGALLYVGVVSLGSGALKDLALALFVGMAAGLYSSVFIAVPLLAQLKGREALVQAGDARALKSRKRNEADRFADVPAFSEDLPIYDEAAPAREDEPVPSDVGARPVARTPRYTAGERGATKKVTPSKSAKRDQPSRSTRSKRGKG